MLSSRVNIGTCIHQGKELPSYIPEVFINGGWTPILSEGSYILKDTYNPLIVCGNCSGKGCNDCRGIGLRKGISVDNKQWAEGFIKIELAKIESTLEVIKKYCISKP
jgi:hypothetical protein